MIVIHYLGHGPGDVKVKEIIGFDFHSRLSREIDEAFFRRFSLQAACPAEQYGYYYGDEDDRYKGVDNRYKTIPKYEFQGG